MVIAPENYSEGGTRRTVCASLCVLWFVLGGCVLLVRVSRLMKQRSPYQLVASYFGQLLRSCARSVSLLSSIDGSHVAKQVNKELQKRRLAFAQNCIPYGNMTAWIVVGTVFYRTMGSEERQNSLLQDACLLVMSFTVLTLQAFPCAVTLRTLDIWSSILAACLALWVSPVAMQGDYAAASALLPFGAMMVLSVFNLNVRLSLTWLCVLSMSICSTILFGSECHGSDCGQSRTKDVQHVIVSACMFGALVVCFNRSMILIAQWETEADMSRTELVAARSVLSCVCDVVVELDGDFQLQDDSPQLKDMLMLNQHRSLLGADLRSFLASQEDYHKFTGQMRRSLSGDQINDEARLSSTFHIQMKDSSNAPIVVEAYSVLLGIRGDQAKYLVGIREFTDTNPMSLMQTDSPSVARQSRRSREGRLDGGGGALAAGLLGSPAAPLGGLSGELVGRGSRGTSSAWSSETSSREEPEVASPFGVQLKGHELMVWIDILSPGYTIKHANSAFAQQVKASGDFLVAVRPSRRSDFIAWAQEAYFSLLEGGFGSAGMEYSDRLLPRMEYSERLHLKPKSPERASRSKRTRHVISATLCLDLTPFPGADPGGGVARIVLQDPQLIKGSHRDRDVDTGARRHSRSGTPSAIATGAKGQLCDEGESEDQSPELGAAVVYSRQDSLAGLGAPGEEIPGGGLGPAILGRSSLGSS